MALIPKISLNISNTCNKIDVWEKTNPYNASTNVGGWGTPNINTGDISYADIKIYDLSNNLVQTIVMFDGLGINIYPAVGPYTPSTFQAYSQINWSQLDGVYKVVYTVSKALVNYVNECQYELFTCNLCNCMGGLVIKMSNLCSGKKLTKYKEVFDQLEIFKYGIMTAFSNADFTSVNILLAEASKLCTTFSDCGCGCSDC